MDAAEHLWAHLRRVTTVKFVAQSQSATGWSGSGAGAVFVDLAGSDVLVFSESGIWRPIRGRESRFTNVFRWTILGPSSVRLEHLRFGPNNPVHLFDLGVRTDGAWVPDDPHVCIQDCYSADLEIEDDGVDVSWSISGPKKMESIRYEYRF
jgi:hypothetical protein